jgi:AMMECR1 domain-containing protein
MLDRHNKLIAYLQNLSTTLKTLKNSNENLRGKIGLIANIANNWQQPSKDF